MRLEDAPTAPNAPDPVWVFVTLLFPLPVISPPDPERDAVFSVTFSIDMQTSVNLHCSSVSCIVNLEGKESASWTLLSLKCGIIIMVGVILPPQGEIVIHRKININQGMCVYYLKHRTSSIVTLTLGMDHWYCRGRSRGCGSHVSNTISCSGPVAVIH